MKMLHQVFGMIWVRGDVGHYGETPEMFHRDFGRRMPTLPEGIDQRIYEPGVRHTFQRGTDVMPDVEAALSWGEGDEILAKLDDLLAKKAMREKDNQEAVLAEARRKMEEENARIMAENQRRIDADLAEANAKLEELRKKKKR
jgi:hypothetical protein